MSAFTRGFEFGFSQTFLGGMFCGFGNFWGFSPCQRLFCMPSFSLFSPYHMYSENSFRMQMPMPDMSGFKVDYNQSVFLTQSQNSFGFKYGNAFDFSDYNYYSGNSYGFDSFSLGSSTQNYTYTINTSRSTKRSTTNSSTSKTKHWSEMTDSEMRSVYGSYERDITTPYKGTAEDLNNYLKGKGVLEGKGQAFIDAQNKYGISASVLVGIAMNESAEGKSDLAKNKNNIGGVRVANSKEFRSFDSVEACIDNMGSFLKSGYVENGGHPLTKLYQANAKYCPASDITDKSGNNSLWASAVDRYAGAVEAALA